jgi:hypothetical protein
MTTTSFALYLASWELLNNSLKANVADLPTFTDAQAELEAALGRIAELKQARQSLEAEKVQGTKDLTLQMHQTREIATRLRNRLRGHYGLDTEKLAEYGISPRRPRRGRSRSQPGPGAAPVPAESVN